MENNKNIFGLVGFPLGHSFSKKFFTEKFDKEDIQAEYRTFELGDISEIRDVLSSGVKGLNVTIPYKQSVIPYLSDLNPIAKEVGSVNTIKIANENGNIIATGYNTDIIGFENSIAPHLTSAHQSGLVLGTGGASKAVAYVLKKLGIRVTFVSRSHANRIITYGDLTADMIRSHLIIVNTTPVGMYPHVDACPDIPYDAIGEKHICFDLIYNPAETLFLKKAKRQNAITINGEAMLIGQAIASWNIWNE